MNKKILLFSLSCLAAAHISAAADSDGSQVNALTDLELKTLAASGSAYYQAVLSNCCRRGDYPGIPMDYESAVKWGRLSSDSGDLLGKYCMAVMTDNGVGIKADPQEASKMFAVLFSDIIKTADLTADPEYSYAAAYMYYSGKGTLQDKTASVKYFRAAAEKGNDLAAYKLASMYYTGDGVASSIPEAMKWLTPSAKNGNPGSQYLMAVLYLKSAAVKNNLHEGARWLKKSADKGNKDAQFLYASLLESGKLGYTEMSQALEYYHKAALQGHLQAQEHLKAFARQMRQELNLPQSPKNPLLSQSEDSPKSE